MSNQFKEGSRTNWFREGDLSNDDLKLGCLQRIADAMELSCKDREKLERAYKYMREQRDRHYQTIEVQRHRIAALRGVITKLKRKQAQP